MRIPVVPGMVGVELPDLIFASAGNFLRTFCTPISSFLCLSRTKLCLPDIVTFCPVGIEERVTPDIVKIFVDVSTPVIVVIPELLILLLVSVSSISIPSTLLTLIVLTPTATVGAEIETVGGDVKLDPPETAILVIELPVIVGVIVSPVVLALVPPPTSVIDGFELYPDPPLVIVKLPVKVPPTPMLEVSTVANAVSPWSTGTSRFPDVNCKLLETGMNDLEEYSFIWFALVNFSI